MQEAAVVILIHIISAPDLPLADGSAIGKSFYYLFYFLLVCFFPWEKFLNQLTGPASVAQCLSINLWNHEVMI